MSRLPRDDPRADAAAEGVQPSRSVLVSDDRRFRSRRRVCCSCACRHAYWSEGSDCWGASAGGPAGVNFSLFAKLAAGKGGGLEALRSASGKSWMQDMSACQRKH